MTCLSTFFISLEPPLPPAPEPQQQQTPVPVPRAPLSEARLGDSPLLQPLHKVTSEAKIPAVPNKPIDRTPLLHAYEEKMKSGKEKDILNLLVVGKSSSLLLIRTCDWTYVQSASR